MKIADVTTRAFSMPLTSPSYPRGPYRFVNREFLTITYRTDIDALRAVVPEPLEVTDPLVKFEFIRMPDSTGFGDYTESGQVIPVSYKGQQGGYVHGMYLNDDAPIAGGREIWGFPKKLADPALRVESETLVGTLDAAGGRTGLLIVSGGNEIRIGAHRGENVFRRDLGLVTFVEREIFHRAGRNALAARDAERFSGEGRIAARTRIGARVFESGAQIGGLFRDLDEIAEHWQPDRAFEPALEEGERERRYRGWREAVQRVCSDNRQ